MNGASHATVALTIGDPNGIGPEIAVKALLKRVKSGDAAPVLIGDEHVIRFYQERHAPGLSLREFTETADPCRSIRFKNVDSLPRANFVPGRVDRAVLRTLHLLSGTERGQVLQLSDNTA
jgi:4-hydroxy-L-threonine phosphate dehydrogenase PdxA